MLHVSYRYFLVNYPGKDGNTGLRLALTNEDSAPLLGDVNLDGLIDVTDLNILISIILGKDKAENYGSRACITDMTPSMSAMSMRWSTSFSIR